MAKSTIFMLVAAIAAAVLIAWYLVGASNVSAANSDAPTTSVAWPDSDEGQKEAFWQLIERTRSGDTDDQQLSNLKTELQKLPTADLEKFIRVFDRLMHDTYSWDLWGAAYVINGGASDDAFEDFRKWLISNGRIFFDQAIAQPDSLSTLIPADRATESSFEEFSYVAAEVWEKKTGKAVSKLPKEKEALYPTEPFGSPFAEDPDALAQQYPKLWRRFGESPLG